MRLHSPCAVVSNNLKRSRLREGVVKGAAWGTKNNERGEETDCIGQIFTE